MHTSGAIQYGDPTEEWVFPSVSCTTAQEPKKDKNCLITEIMRKNIKVKNILTQLSFYSKLTFKRHM